MSSPRPAHLGLLGLLALAACGAHHAAPAPTADPQPAPNAQGLRGRVLVLTGDFMPPGQGVTTPAAGAPVHVFAGPHAVVDQLAAGDPSLVGTYTTGADGSFAIALPPGIYTVVTEHAGRPYLNCFAGSGGWCTAEVTAGAWTTYDLTDSADATF